MLQFAVGIVMLGVVALAAGGCTVFPGGDARDQDHGRDDTDGGTEPDAGEPDGGVAPDPGVEATVGAEGGAIEAPDGTRLDIPPGALSSATTITLRRLSDPPAGAVGPVYEIGPDGTVFDEPVALTLPYDPSALGGTAETDLTLATGDNDGWHGQGWALLDPSRHVVTGYITHLSTWAIVPVPPDQACSPNYDCMQLCSGSQPPELCCSDFRNTCRAVMHASFPAYVACYAQCVGTPTITNFGNSECMGSCCTGHRGTVTAQGACSAAGASLQDGQAVLACSRACFDGADVLSVCSNNTNPFSSLCEWQAVMTPSPGGETAESECGTAGEFLSGFLYTGLSEIPDQVMGDPAALEITGGSLDATSLSADMTCLQGVHISGTATAEWTTDRFLGTWTLGSQSGDLVITPAW